MEARNGKVRHRRSTEEMHAAALEAVSAAKLRLKRAEDNCLRLANDVKRKMGRDLDKSYQNLRKMLESPENAEWKRFVFAKMDGKSAHAQEDPCETTTESATASKEPSVADCQVEHNSLRHTNVVGGENQLPTPATTNQIDNPMKMAKGDRSPQSNTTPGTAALPVRMTPQSSSAGLKKSSFQQIALPARRARK